MARASTQTLLPLDTFAKICGIHPLHFNQVVVADIAPAAVCDMPVTQYSWQEADRIGREEIAQAIAHAESIIIDKAHFSPAPMWVIDERLRFDRPYWPELYNINALNVRGQRVSLRTQQNHLISGGIETKTLISAGAAIVYSDGDGDGYDETATIIVATSVTNPEEIAIYYPGESGANEWEVRPITVTISGGNATIVAQRQQLVLPDLQEALLITSVDGLNNSNFLTTVDVYRHYNSPEQQVMFLWDGDPSLCGCSGDGCEACAHYTQNGCLLIRDYRLGIVIPSPGTYADGAWSRGSFSQGRMPDQARLWYYAGERIGSSLHMPKDWERIITYLALSYLDRPLCACRPLESFVARWKEDLSYQQSSPTQSSSFSLSKRWLDNPIGTTRGAIEAWRKINESKIDA